MRKFILFFLVILLFGGIALVRPLRIIAQDSCTSNSCTMVTCTYTHTVPIYNNYGVQIGEHTYQTQEPCCQINTPGGNCICCADGGCYFGCETQNTPTEPPDPPNPATPTPTPTPIQEGTVRARSVVIPSAASTCADVYASTEYIAAPITLYPPGIVKTTSTGGGYTDWLNQRVYVPPYTTYGVSVGALDNYIAKVACWQRDLPAAVNGNGFTANLYNSSTLTWDIGFTFGTPWAQVLGGDVYAADRLRSYTPADTSPRYFNLTPSIGMNGVTTYGTDYDFASESPGRGTTYVSTPGWLANDTNTATDYYTLMFHRFGAPTDADADFTGTTVFTSIADLPESPKTPGVVYVNGDLTIDTSNWTVGSGQSIVVLVNGNLAINRRINLTGTGFVAFIVNGDISVATTVGTTAASTTPVVEGVYITSPTGTFRTGASTTAAARRFVGKGTFVAGHFDLGRDLDADALNTEQAAELFIYNPNVLIHMPEVMKDTQVLWQEVAP